RRVVRKTQAGARGSPPPGSEPRDLVEVARRIRGTDRRRERRVEAQLANHPYVRCAIVLAGSAVRIGEEMHAFADYTFQLFLALRDFGSCLLVGKTCEDRVARRVRADGHSRPVQLTHMRSWEH